MIVNSDGAVVCAGGQAAGGAGGVHRVERQLPHGYPRVAEQDPVGHGQ